jgi:hypothetical protein
VYNVAFARCLWRGECIRWYQEIRFSEEVSNECPRARIELNFRVGSFPWKTGGLCQTGRQFIKNLSLCSFPSWRLGHSQWLFWIYGWVNRENFGKECCKCWSVIRYCLSHHVSLENECESFRYDTPREKGYSKNVEKTSWYLSNKSN